MFHIFRNSLLYQSRLLSSTFLLRHITNPALSTNTKQLLAPLNRPNNSVLTNISSSHNFSTTTTGDQDLDDEELYWESLKAGLESEELPLIPEETQQQDMLSKREKKKFFGESPIGKSVFVLQLKMQYRSKARQSTTAELQLAESISLINTIYGWKVTDSMIVSTKRSGSAGKCFYYRNCACAYFLIVIDICVSGIFGTGNQEMLAKRICSSGCQALFVVIDRLTNLQVETIRRRMLGGNGSIKIYDRYMIVLEIFKRNANSSIAKLQIALGKYLLNKNSNLA